MQIGILSDTHDNLPLLRKAVAMFNEAGVEHVIHAGDFVSPFTFRVLKDLKAELTGIFGNNDGDRLLLKKHSGGRVFRQPHVMELCERKIVVLHEHHLVEAVAASGHYDLVIYGHTHEPEVRRVGATLVVNPGEASGWLYGKPSIAFADLADLTADLVYLG